MTYDAYAHEGIARLETRVGRLERRVDAAPLPVTPATIEALLRQVEVDGEGKWKYEQEMLRGARSWLIHLQRSLEEEREDA